MPPSEIVPAAALEQAALLALNNAHATELSPLDAAGLDRLLATAAHATGVAPAEALLIAFDQDADYASPNFLWWRARRPRFLYVDRLVVAPHARGKGVARALYADLFARHPGSVVVCEVNADPPNPASDAFHAAHGFTYAGEATLPDRGKRVRHLERVLPPGRPSA